MRAMMRSLLMVCAMMLISQSSQPVITSAGFAGWGLVAWKFIAMTIAMMLVDAAMEGKGGK